MANYMDPLMQANVGGASALPGLKIAYVGPSTGDDALLSRMGAHVQSFVSGEDAFAAVLERDFDLVLVHLQLGAGGIGGPEFVRLLRSCGHPIKSQVPVVGLANARQLQFADRLSGVGITALLSTPIDVTELNATVARLLGNRSASEQGNFFGSGASNAGNFGQQSGAGPSWPRNTHAPAGPRPSAQTAVDPMKQRNDISESLSTTAPGGAGDRKGLLERLGDKILARLAKNAGAPEQPSGLELPPLQNMSPPAFEQFQRPQPSSGNVGRQRSEPSARPAGQVPRAPSASAPSPAPVPRPRPASPVQQTAPAPGPARTSAPRPAAMPRPASAPQSAPQTEAVAPARQPYISRIHRRVASAAVAVPRQTAVAPAAVSAMASAAPVEDSPGYRLSQEEKNRVYERVRKLVSTARRTAQDAGGAPTPETSKPPQAQRSLRVCFLEDSCTSSHAIREMLGERGHEVDHFSQAEEAFDAFLEKNYDLLLASQIESLGGMDCEKLVRELRNSPNPAKSHAPIIVLTANPDPANLQLFRRVGATDVVVKPVDGERLHERVMAAIAPKVAATTAPRSNKALRVCFLEDSCTSSHAIREMLGDAGHEVDHFSSAEEALDALTEREYDVLLASQIVALGGMDCLGLVEAVRRLPDERRRLLPVVALTANTDPSNIESFYVAGASDVVVKPIEGKELNKRVAQSVAARPALEAKNAAAAHLRVCFLEDSCTSSHAIREMLGDAGHEVDHFSSPEEALDALNEKRYDLLLASQIVALGGMDCEQLVRRLRASAKDEQRNLPVLVITANPEPANVDKFYGAGANDVAIKPIEGKALNERVRDVVQVKAMPAPVASPPVLPAPPRNLKVCFLEDSCTSSHAIREMLGEAGHEVDHFSTPEEALDAFLEKDYDVLLASQLPSLGGLDTGSLIQEVRAAGGVRGTKPVVLLTTDPSAENQQNFRRKGVNDVVIKPVEGNLSQRLQEVVSRQGAPKSGPARPAPVVVPEHLKVCFLEDSCTSSHAIREMLGEAGHEVDHFSSAEEALDAFMEKRYDVMLASQIVALGGLDCEGMMRGIRGAAQPQKRQAPVVAITANPDNGNIESLKRAGADAVIVKPIEGDLGGQLKQVVGRVLGQPVRPQLRVVPSAAAPAAAPAAAAAAPSPAAARPAPVVKPMPKAAPGGAGPSPAQPAARMPSPQAAPAPTAPGGAPLFDLKAPSSLSGLGQGKSSTAVSGRDRRIVIAVAAAGILAVAFSTWHHFGEALPVDVVAVEQGPIFEAINAPGQVVSKKRVELTTAIPGQIVKVSVKEGDSVKKGQVLATLDDRDATIQIQRAEANLESAKKDVTLTERTLDRLVRALQMGAVSRQMAEDAEAAVHAARAKQRVAAEEARAAQLLAERLNVIAPFDGVVTVNYAVDGLWAEPPGPLFQLVDMTQREVELKIPAEQVSRLNSGQKVNLSSEAFPGHQWTEQIVRVAPATSREQGMANTLSVYATLGPDSPPLRFGQQVDAQIRTAGNERATRVPLGAVTIQNGRPVVAVIDEGHVRFKPVATGIESFSHIEIREGLKPGDKVILLNKPLEEGAKVEPVELPG